MNQLQSVYNLCCTNVMFHPEIKRHWASKLLLLTPKSDKNLISPYMITSESHIQVTGIKEMIIKLLIVKHILQCLRKCTENSIESMHTDGLRK